jgi:hypothetical protein
MVEPSKTSDSQNSDAEHEPTANLTRAVSVDPAFIAVLVACAIAWFGIFAHYVLQGGP